MMQLIKTAEDVQAFFLCLKTEGLNFHPDTPMQDYINLNTGLPTYNVREAELREDMLVRCIQVCTQLGVDIYELANEVFADVMEAWMDEMEQRWEARKYAGLEV